MAENKNKDEIDISLGDEDFFGKPEENKSTSNNTEPKNIPENTILADEKGIPELRGTDYPQEYKDMAEFFKAQYRMLPKLNYDAILKELEDLTVTSSPCPTLQVLNDELHRIQASKDRLSEILTQIIRCYNIKSRAVDVLKDSWGKYTGEKNTEGRKGDAAYRLSNFLADFAELEAIFKVCNHILKNLDSLHDNLSRRITIWQMMLKLRDVGRGAMPEMDFHRFESQASLFGEKEVDDKDENGEPKLRNI